ncbi:MAG: Rho termination factor N-terminal domain-containing protein, partial [Promethearchaeota archaeon]
MKRNIENRTYLKYLLQSLNVNELKQICRNFDIKGFSRLKKSELIDFILDSLAEEEFEEILKQKELEIISNGIDLAIKKINGEDRETLAEIRIVNPNEHEIELQFKGWNWEVLSFLSITPKNIYNPDRDCDCRIGSEMGFCSHFWIGFIYSLKQDWFKIKDWTLTILPEDFEEKIKNITLAEAKTGEKSDILIDESSTQSKLMNYVNSRITIYDGEISEIERRESEFQGNTTIFYMITLKNVRFGPQLKKKSDYDENDIDTIEKLQVRISDNVFEKINLSIGDKISCNGGVSKDNFWGLMIKR